MRSLVFSALFAAGLFAQAPSSQPAEPAPAKADQVKPTEATPKVCSIPLIGMKPPSDDVHFTMQIAQPPQALKQLDAMSVKPPAPPCAPAPKSALELGGEFLK
jgi:hypothetical protein